MLIINFIARLAFILRSAIAPAEIAAGFALGMIIGLTPSLFVTAVIFLLLIIFNVNIASGLLAMALFRIVAYLFDPLFHSFGYFLLAGVQPLEGLWTLLYNTPFIPLTGYNNTVVLGSFIISIILLLPVYMGAKRGIIIYRERYDKKIQNMKIVRYLKATKVFKIYKRLEHIGEVLWQ